MSSLISESGTRLSLRCSVCASERPNAGTFGAAERRARCEAEYDQSERSKGVPGSGDVSGSTQRVLAGDAAGRLRARAIART